MFEAKEKASLYRAKKRNNSYLLLNVMIVNDSNEIAVIREIGATMRNKRGYMLHESLTVWATHLGQIITSKGDLNIPLIVDIIG